MLCLILNQDGMYLPVRHRILAGRKTESFFLGKLAYLVLIIYSFAI